MRTVPRYFLTPSLDGFLASTPVRVVDIGLKGARVEMNSRIEAATVTDLRFASITTRVQVLWCQVDSLNFELREDHYLAGVAFEERNPLIHQLIELLTAREAAIAIADNRALDRYRINAPLTGSFGEIAPVSVVDLSLRGARIAIPHTLGPGAKGALRFQADGESGPISAEGEVVWCRPGDSGRGYEAGVSIVGAEDQLRRAIERLCLRNEARIEIDSLRRKFDALRLEARRCERECMAV